MRKKFSQEFSVQSTTKCFFLIDNHFKLFTDQSEMSALPAGYLAFILFNFNGNNFDRFVTRQSHVWIKTPRGEAF